MLTLRVMAVAILVMFAVCPVRGQDDDLLKTLGAVDQKQRPQLARRLRLFMDHQRNRRWDELYKLIDKVNAEHWRGKITPSCGTPHFLRQSVDAPRSARVRLVQWRWWYRCRRSTRRASRIG